MKEDSSDKLDELIAISKKIADAQLPDFMKESLFKMFVMRDTTSSPKEETSGADPSDNDDGNDFEFPSNIKRFMRSHEVSDNQVGAVFHLDPGGVDYLITELDVKNNKEGLRQCVLLVGLKSALESNSFKVPLNDVRELAGNMGVYDGTNFSAYMKSLKDVLKNYKPGEDTELSGVGIREAMNLLKSKATE